MTCQTAMGGASSATENDVTAKDKDKSNSNNSMASFNNLQCENRNPLHADEINSKPGSEPSSREKKEKKPKRDLRDESPYAKKDYAPTPASSDSRLKKKHNNPRSSGLEEPLDAGLEAAPKEENGGNLPTI